MADSTLQLWAEVSCCNKDHMAKPNMFTIWPGPLQKKFADLNDSDQMALI